jgi:hypothetical protein
MKKIPFILMVALFAITACTPATAQPTVTDEPPPTQQPSDSIPVPSDSNLVRGNVILESTDLLTLESFPLQFILVLKGGLPPATNCGLLSARRIRITKSLLTFIQFQIQMQSVRRWWSPSKRIFHLEVSPQDITRSGLMENRSLNSTRNSRFPANTSHLRIYQLNQIIDP